ncbi:hypothetical protein MUU72_14405 [Streptomyces sp. RS10V-4]|uniref:hypothetical protein n=1 Tax=Streptomyces rhizoryzae TaxID=2932493 RepID=UPI002005AF74|nr:hypothetical protein [Streptomyces rhizoryzae]MCK7624278.1 hypothetical protein [Streptomyces rhizoryzae]
MNSPVSTGGRRRGRAAAAVALAMGAVLMASAAAGAADLGMILYTTPQGKKATLSQPLPGHCYTLAGSGSTANLSLVGKSAHFYAKPHCAGAPVADLGPGKRRDLRFASLRLDADQ